jgi:hypothetical protein
VIPSQFRQPGRTTSLRLPDEGSCEEVHTASDFFGAEPMHDTTQIERCRNPQISTHILEGEVFELIRETMIDLQSVSGATRLEFRMKGEIDRAAVRRNAQRRRPAGRRPTYRSGAA